MDDTDGDADQCRFSRYYDRIIRHILPSEERAGYAFLSVRRHLRC